MTTATARAICFGAPRPELFGWIHEAPAPAAFALVICSPFGDDEVLAHSSLRRLAQASAATGVPALRFDCHGIGDSAGDELEPGRLDAWTASVHQAIDAAKQHTGAGQVCLLGVRFGAALATLAACERDDVLGIAAIAPVTSGRAYVRELKFAAMAGAATVAGPGGGAEAALASPNFVLAPSTLADMSRIDLTRLPRPPAPSVLLLDRDDLPCAAAWAQHLLGLGVDVAAPAVSGYSALMGGRTPESATSAPLTDEVVGWLRGLRAIAKDREDAAPSSQTRPSPWIAAGHGVRDEPVQIDAGVPLFGVMSMPPPGHPRRQPVLLLAAGLARRTGQDRLYVQLARELAAQGHIVLRLDVSGIGDSPPHPGFAERSLYEPTAVNDVAAAADHLCRVAATPDCVLVGHCSGAFNAFRCAVGGAPVSRVVQINPLIFSSRDRRMLAGTPAQPLSARHAQGRSAATRLGLGRIERALSRRWQRLAQRLGWRYARELTALAANGVRLDFIFGDIGSAEAVLRRQAGRRLDELAGQGRLTVTRLPGADHILHRWEDRQTVLRLLVDMLRDGRRTPLPQPVVRSERAAAL